MLEYRTKLTLKVLRGGVQGFCDVKETLYLDIGSSLFYISMFTWTSNLIEMIQKKALLSFDEFAAGLPFDLFWNCFPETKWFGHFGHFWHFGHLLGLFSFLWIWSFWKTAYGQIWPFWTWQPWFAAKHADPLILSFGDVSYCDWKWFDLKNFKFVMFGSTFKLVYNDHPWDPKIVAVCWQVVVVQRYLDVINIENGARKWWSL